MYVVCPLKMEEIKAKYQTENNLPWQTTQEPGFPDQKTEHSQNNFRRRAKPNSKSTSPNQIQNCSEFQRWPRVRRKMRAVEWEKKRGRSHMGPEVTAPYTDTLRGKFSSILPNQWHNTNDTTLCRQDIHIL
jgi:hypothetical protein